MPSPTIIARKGVRRDKYGRSVGHGMEDTSFHLQCDDASILHEHLEEVVRAAVNHVDAKEYWQGSTLAAAVVSREKLTVANIGDSSVFVLKRRKDNPDARWTCARVNAHHDCYNAAEIERLGFSRNGGAITETVDDGRRVRDDLQITRSVGDTRLAGAVISDHDYYEVEFDDDYEYVVLLTSDIIDHPYIPLGADSQQEVERHIAAYANFCMPPNASDEQVARFTNQLAIGTMREWDRGYNSRYRDDATFVAIRRPEHAKAHFLGVCDGHGGSRVSSFLKRFLPKRMDNTATLIRKIKAKIAEITAELSGVFHSYRQESRGEKLALLEQTLLYLQGKRTSEQLSQFIKAHATHYNNGLSVTSTKDLVKRALRLREPELDSQRRKAILSAKAA